MRLSLSTVSMTGTVIIGEGEKDDAPMLFNGEEVGSGDGPEIDIAVDPVDGTTLLVGTTAAVAAFDSAGGLVSGLKPLRRPMMLVSAVGFTVIAILDVCITLAQLICEERSCSLPKFLHWGLILTEEWATRGNLGLSKDLTYGQGRGYVYVAVLTLSLALTIFLCGVHAFGSYRFAVNLDGAGDYIYDDAGEVDAEEAKLAPLAGEEDMTGSSEGAADAPLVPTAPMGPIATA